MTKRNNKLLFIFDYDETLKSERGAGPDTSLFKRLIDAVKRQTGLPAVILTTGTGRAYEKMFTISPVMMRPIDYLETTGLKYTYNSFSTLVDVCVFDIKYDSTWMLEYYGTPLIDEFGRKNLASLNYIVLKSSGFIVDMIFFDDLKIHHIKPNKTAAGFIDPATRANVVYILMRRLEPDVFSSEQRIQELTEVVEKKVIERKKYSLVLYKKYGNDPPIYII